MHEQTLEMMIDNKISPIIDQEFHRSDDALDAYRQPRLPESNVGKCDRILKARGWLFFAPLSLPMCPNDH